MVWLPFIFPEILGVCHHPNWRTHIFQRGGYTTTNQMVNVDPYMEYIRILWDGEQYHSDKLWLMAGLFLWQYITIWWEFIDIQQDSENNTPWLIGNFYNMVNKRIIYEVCSLKHLGINCQIMVNCMFFLSAGCLKGFDHQILWFCCSSTRTIWETSDKRWLLW